MRVLLACREFDAENDHRLKQLLADGTACPADRPRPLAIPQVEDAVRRAGVDPAKLTPHDLVLLQTPQNLSLFLQGGPEEHGQVGSVQALLNRYWDHKRGGWSAAGPGFALTGHRADAGRLAERTPDPERTGGRAR